YLASTSLNLQQAMYLLEQYYPLLFQQTNLEQLKIVEQDQQIQIMWSANYQDYREIYELNLSLIFRISKLIAQEQL
ncbi:AraC family transcriptional regulator, partial [Acinetobacter nosocomialis]